MAVAHVDEVRGARLVVSAARDAQLGAVELLEG